MTDYPLFSEPQEVLQNSTLLMLLPVCLLIQAVQKTIVDIICFQGLKLPVYRTFYGFQICSPSISTFGIICAKMDLIKSSPLHLSLPFQRPENRTHEM